MRTRNLLDDEEYIAQRNRFKADLARIDESLRGTEVRAESWLEATERAFDFATYARSRFQDGDLVTKRDILMTLGENFQLKDQKLTIQQSAWLVPIGEQYPAIEAEYLRRVRTNQKASSKVKEEALDSVSESWRAIWDSTHLRRLRTAGPAVTYSKHSSESVTCPCDELLARLTRNRAATSAA